VCTNVLMWVNITVRWLKNSYVWSCALQAKVRGHRKYRAGLKLLTEPTFPYYSSPCVLVSAGEFQ